MGATDRFFAAIKEVLVLSNEVERLADEVKDLGGLVRDVDRRLVRIETMVELAGGKGRLPDKG